MTNDNTTLAAPTSLAIWILSGFFSWCLSTYIFTGLMLPVAFRITAAVSGIPTLSWAVPALRVLIPHIPAYLLGFVFCLILGRVSRVTIPRIGGFIVAANGVSLYYHMMQLAGLLTHHYGGSGSSALSWILLGLVSMLVISPFFIIMGSLAGRAMRKRAILTEDASGNEFR